MCFFFAGLYASIGEAYLVLDEPEKCVSWYRQALEKASGHMGSISSMYRNLLLLQSVVVVPHELQELFLASLGRVLVCAAHPLVPWTGPYVRPAPSTATEEDASSTSATPKAAAEAAKAVKGAARIEEGEEDADETAMSPRTPHKPLSVQVPQGARQTSASSSAASSGPPSSAPPPLASLSPAQRHFRMLESRVLAEIRSQLSLARPTVAFVFLLTDTDLLFAEALMERGVEVHVLLVYTKAIFMQRCIEHGFERLHNWKQRIDAVFKRTILHFVTRDKQNTQKQLLYHFNRRVLQGLTILRAQQLDCGDPLALCVLDGLDSAGNPLPEGAPSSSAASTLESPRAQAGPSSSSSSGGGPPVPLSMVRPELFAHLHDREPGGHPPDLRGGERGIREAPNGLPGYP